MTVERAAQLDYFDSLHSSEVRQGGQPHNTHMCTHSSDDGGGGITGWYFYQSCDERDTVLRSSMMEHNGPTSSRLATV